MSAITTQTRSLSGSAIYALTNAGRIEQRARRIVEDRQGQFLLMLVDGARPISVIRVFSDLARDSDMPLLALIDAGLIERLPAAESEPPAAADVEQVSIAAVATALMTTAAASSPALPGRHAVHQTASLADYHAAAPLTAVGTLAAVASPPRTLAAMPTAAPAPPNAWSSAIAAPPPAAAVDAVTRVLQRALAKMQGSWWPSGRR